MLQTHRSKVPPWQPPAFPVQPVPWIIKCTVPSPSLWSQPQMMNSRCKTQVIYGKGSYKEKEVLPERLNLKAIINSMPLPLWRRGSTVAPAGLQSDLEGRLLSTVSLPQPSAYGSTGLLLQVACYKYPKHPGMETGTSPQSKHGQFNQVRMRPVPSRRKRVGSV